jgi:ABC-type lipoprotein export system ATPase subunit
MSDNKIIFSMIGVGKVHKPNKQVLKDIYLSFYYGAKIGVLGLNGAGKSTLLRIIAGVDNLNVLFLTPLPGTRLWDQMKSEDRIALDAFRRTGNITR